MSEIANKIENYLLQCSYVYNKLSDNSWTVNDQFEGIDNLVIYYDEPIVVFRLKLMDIPSGNKEAFYQKLLELNTTSLVHGAYALEKNNVIIVDTLEAANLDLNEFQASIEAIYMAIANDYKVLKQFMK
jgi:hypothetical protein